MDGLPGYLRFLSKFTFDILPAALASVIGGFLFTQYHARLPEKPAVIETAAPAQAQQAHQAQVQEAIKLVRDEHNMIVDYLKGQQAETAKRNASFDQARAKAAADAREAAAARDTAAREAAAREAAKSEAVLREAADKLAALKRRDAEQAKLKSLIEVPPARPVEVATVEPQRPQALTPPAPLAPSAQSANDLRPPADIPNAPRRTGPIDATIGFARDVTGKAVSTVLEIPGWLGDRILGPSPSTPATGGPSGRLTSAQW